MTADECSVPGFADPGCVDDQNPWPGLAAFQEADQRFFHGRETEADHLLGLISRSRLTVMFGMAGLGKTSLIQAGLFPRLRKEAVLPVYVRLDHDEESRDLASQVREAVLREAEAARIEGPSPRAGETLWEFFHHVDAGFWDERNMLVTPLLAIDQFEEIFTLGRSTPGRARRTEDFLVQLADLIEGRPPEVVRKRLDQEPDEAGSFAFNQDDYRIMIGLREDFLPDLEVLRTTIPSLAHNRFRLQRMDGEKARDALLCAGGHLLRDESVAEHIVRFVAKAEQMEVPLGDLEVEPALLSVISRELNNKRLQEGAAFITNDLLHGHQREVLQEFYERSLGGFDPRVREFVEDEFVTGAGYRTSVPEEDALRAPGITPEVLSRLVDLRLLRIESRPGARRYELTHDVLTEVIRASRDNRQQRQDLQRVRDELRHSQRLVAVLVLFLSMAVFAAFGLLWGFFQQKKAREAQIEAEEAQAQAQRALAGLDLKQADALFEVGRGSHGLAYLARVVRLGPDSAVVRSRILDFMSRRGWHFPKAVLEHEDVVYSAEFSPDGKQVVTASWDRTARLWDTATGEALGRPMKHDGLVFFATFSDDGRLVATASVDKTARTWDARTGRPVSSPMRHRDVVNFADFDPTGRRVVTASRDGTARVWDARTGKPLGPPLRHGRSVYSAQFSPDGQQLLTASWDQRARLWDLRTGTVVGKPLSQEGWLFSAQFSPDGGLIVTAAGDGTAQVWDARTGRPLGPPLRHTAGERVRSAQFSPDGRRVITASWDNTARIWDARQGRELIPPMRHLGRVHSARFSPNGLYAVTASGDGTARIWDASSGLPIGEPLHHGGWVYSAQFSPDSEQVVTASEDGAAQIWQVKAGRGFEATLRHLSPVHLALFSPDGRLVLTGAGDRVMRVWDAGSERPVGIPMPHASWTHLVRFGAEGDLILTASADETLRLWDLKTGTPVGAPMYHSRRVRDAQFISDDQVVVTVSADGILRQWDVRSSQSRGEPVKLQPKIDVAAFSPGGERVAITSGGIVRVWDVANLRPVGIPMDCGEPINSVEFSPDVRKIVTAMVDGTARVWDLQTSQQDGRDMRHEGPVAFARFSPQGTRILTVSGITARLWTSQGASTGQPMVHGGLIYSARFSPDSQRVATASANGSARVWDASTGEALGAPLVHRGEVRSVQFSPDNQRLVTASSDGTARIWDLPTGMPEESNLMASLIESVGGYMVSDTGEVVRVPKLNARLAQLRQELRESEVRLSPFLRWFVTDCTERTRSPLSLVTVREFVQERLADGSAEARAQAMSACPGPVR